MPQESQSERQPALGRGFTEEDAVYKKDQFTILSYGVWKEKKNYGKTYMGIERSAFLIGPDGKLRNVWYKISPKDTPVRLLEALAG